MPKECNDWIERPVIKESIYPSEWWNGRIWTITRGELPWWPLNREVHTLQVALRKAGQVRGFKVTTHKVDDNTVQWMAEPNG